MKYKNEILVNGKGEILEILQEPREISEEDKDKLFIVPLEGYYEVFNEQRYDKAKWDFKLKQWVGVGEQRPIPTPQITETQKLWDAVNYLISSGYNVERTE